jgi:hypothetical protein
MKEVFLLQYRLLQKSRAVLFDFLEAEIGEGINTPVAAYNMRPNHSRTDAAYRSLHH